MALPQPRPSDRSKGAHMKKHEPNFENLRRALLRQGPPGPVPLLEIGIEPAAIGAVLGEKMPLAMHVYGPQTPRLATEDDVMKGVKSLDMLVRFCVEMGYDFVFIFTVPNLPRSFDEAADLGPLADWSDGLRYWQDETTGPIQNWEDFEKYPWPRPEDIEYGALDYLNLVVPGGMKVSANMTGIFETASFLMGFQSFAYALYDQPDLVEAIVGRVADLTASMATHAASLDNVGMIVLADDMGYNRGTLVKHDFLRSQIYPQQKRIADIAHSAGKVFILHSCGNLTLIMDDLITDVGMDGKHSFEDTIMPVEEVFERWSDRISILGGVDVGLLTRGTPEQVRARTRQILDACGARGTAYGLGSGNSICAFMPRENYLAMVDEWRRWNEEHFGAA
jgi:uroporphyrinogen decarboxylase